MKIVTVLCFAVFIAGCGSAEQRGPVIPSQPVASRDLPERKAARKFVFTCQNGTFYKCRIFSAAGRLVRTRTKALVDPQGVAAGSDGLVYVANEGALNVLVYSAGGRRLLRTLDDGGNVPLDVAVFGQTVAASNLHNVTFFGPGATHPTRTLKDANVFQGSGVAFDPSGNCYWSFTNEQLHTQLDEFTGCKGKPKSVPIAAGSHSGLAFDGEGNLWYTSGSTQAPGVYRCQGTAQCQIFDNQFVDPIYICFTHDFGDLWVQDAGSDALYEIDIASGDVVQTITDDLTFDNPPTGVASAPGPL